MINEDLIQSGKITGYILSNLKKAIVPGISALELDELAQNLTSKLNAKPAFKNFNNYPHSICISLNNQLVHGIPTHVKIKQHDLVSIDYGANYKGWITDAAFTIGVNLTDATLTKFLSDTLLALENAIKKAVIGNTIYDISLAIENVAKVNNYSIAKNLTGHGVGKSLHEKPIIPNFTSENLKRIKLKEGMSLAIEPMFGNARIKNEMLIETRVDLDNWTLTLPKSIMGAHFEHSIYLTNKQPIILTKLVDNI